MKESENFPTGKNHVSFSEVKHWKECPYRHKLIYIDKVDMHKPSPYLDFGTAVHAGCELLLEGKNLEKEKLLTDIRAAWKKYDFDNPEWVKEQPQWYRNSYAPLEEWCQWASNMWEEVVPFLDTQFPGWTIHKAEEELYEPVSGKELNFKGFIDGVIKVPKKRGTGDEYWIIDWKTAGSGGWRSEKKRDFLMQLQLVLYKYYWAEKHKVPHNQIRCAFITLGRGAKKGKVCQIVNVSAGPKTLAKGVKVLNSMISGVRRNLYLKNRNSCKYCPYYQTEHCT
jgi:ATP-dependent exoDNAse (exonuclease V) beta subunit